VVKNVWVTENLPWYSAQTVTCQQAFNESNRNCSLLALLLLVFSSVKIFGTASISARHITHHSSYCKASKNVYDG